MRVHRSRQFRVNMGNYEHQELGASLTVDPEDVWGDDLVGMPTDPRERAQALNAFAFEMITAFLKPELAEAAELSQAKESILPEPAPKPAAPRRERTRTTTRSTR